MPARVRTRHECPCPDQSGPLCFNCPRSGGTRRSNKDCHHCFPDVRLAVPTKVSVISRNSKKFDPKQAQLKAQSDEIDSLKNALKSQGDKLSDAEPRRATRDHRRKGKALQRSAGRCAERLPDRSRRYLPELWRRRSMKFCRPTRSRTATRCRRHQHPAEPHPLGQPVHRHHCQAIVQAYNVKSGVPARPCSSSTAGARPAGAGRRPPAADPTPQHHDTRTEVGFGAHHKMTPPSRGHFCRVCRTCQLTAAGVKRMLSLSYPLKTRPRRQKYLATLWKKMWIPGHRLPAWHFRQSVDVFRRSHSMPSIKALSYQRLLHACLHKLPTSAAPPQISWPFQLSTN